MIIDIDLAIKTHLSWTSKFQEALESGKLLTPEIIAKVDQCDLGRIISSTEVHELSTELQTLEQAHRNFHFVASKMADLITSNSPNAREVVFSSIGEFQHASRQTILALESLRNSTKRK